MRGKVPTFAPILRIPLKLRNSESGTQKAILVFAPRFQLRHAGCPGSWTEQSGDSTHEGQDG